MTKYPSAEEREKIVANRKQLAQELIGCLVIENERKRDKKLSQLVHRYGQAEVERELRFLRDNLAVPRSLEEDEAIIYRKYVDYYRRFGGQRPLLSPEEYASLNDKYSPLLVRQETGQTLTSAEQEHLSHLTDLMLKEATFWEDLVPENPPPTMPETDLPALPTSRSPEIESPLCPRDGFPILPINGKPECSVEYIDRCVGGQTVVDVVQQGRTAYYVFENGHQVPLLCACCGKALAVPDLVKERKRMQGRRLEAMSMMDRVTQAGYEYYELTLEFSKSGILSSGIAQPVSFEVAARMRHPASCPHRKRVSSTKKKKPSRQKVVANDKNQNAC